jgi:3-phosphoshikimate 1-carboxyvinyltransferase
MSYPPSLEIVPLCRIPTATVRVPGSKSITNRALVLAALSGQGCELRGALQSEDTEVMIESLRRLDFRIEVDWPSAVVSVRPNHTDRVIPAMDADLHVANSGTTMRFLTAMVSAGSGRYRLDGIPRMRERPIADLLLALRDLGVAATSENGNDCPPVQIESEGIKSGQVSIRGDTSSQFLSALLMASLRAKGHITIRWHGPFVSAPYIAMTLEQMKQFGATVNPMAHGNPGHMNRPTGQFNFLIPAPQKFGIPSYQVEPDASAASYFWGAAAIARGTVSVEGLGGSLQGDVRFVNVLEKMGCKTQGYCLVKGRPLHGIDVDMNDISDTVMTLAAVACFAEGPTTIRNVAHIRHKETDRLAALATELRRVGAEIDEFADGLTITPRPLHGAEIETYNDHRMAMSMALIGLKVPGIVIKNPGCVAKTYPRFFDDLEKLR